MVRVRRCLLVFLLALALTARAQKDEDKAEDDKKDKVKNKTEDDDDFDPFLVEEEDKNDYVVTEEVWLDLEIKNYYGEDKPFIGRVVIAVFGEICPLTALNFISLAKGYNVKGKKLHYRHTTVHRIVKDFMVQMGDVENKGGVGGVSIYGGLFHDENFKISHRAGGIVSMANNGDHDTNGSQFFITLQRARWLDGKNVAFAKVIRGMEVIQRIAKLKSRPSGKPLHRITIIDSGVNDISQKYRMPPDYILIEGDIDK